MDYYEILGISKDSNQDDIRKAYKKLSKQYHPDLNGNDTEAVEKFKQVQAAYETLSDSSKRARYDNPTKFRSGNPFAGSNPFDFFRDDLWRRNDSYRGRNIQVRIELTLQEVLKGCDKKIKVQKRDCCAECKGHGFTDSVSCQKCGGNGFQSLRRGPLEMTSSCPECLGTGKESTVKCESCKGDGFTEFKDKVVSVKIPPGVENGMQIKVPGEGEAGKNNGQNGDLYVFILVKEHELFVRQKNNLMLNVPVSYSQVVLGCDLEVTSLSEEKLKVKIPPGTESGTRFRLKGKGLPDVRTGVGDLIVFVKVESPKELNDEYLDLFHKLAEMEQKYITPKRKAWSGKAE